MIGQLKRKIANSVKSRRINIILLFLLLSAVILVLTKLSQTYTNTLAFEIKKKNVSEELIVLNDSNQKINVTLKTHGYKLFSYYFNAKSIDVDFKTEVIKNDSVYIWTKNRAFSNVSKQFGEHVEVIAITPDTIKFRYGVNSVKRIPVRLNADISYALGYDTMKAPRLIPDSITVIGPSVLVSEMQHIETEEIILNDINKSIDQSLKLKLNDINENLKIKDDDIELKVEVEKFTEGVFNVPIEIINVPDSIAIKYYPKTVNVVYYTSLNAFKEVEKKDFKIIGDYNTSNDAEGTMQLTILKSSANAKSAKLNTEKIEFIISK